MKVSIFWFRRDLRLEDNMALYHALNSGYPVLPLFIFDTNLLRGLPKNDARVNFIYDRLRKINDELQSMESSILVYQGDPVEVWHKILKEYEVQQVYFNKDYEPVARKRDAMIQRLLSEHNIECHVYKDQVIFEENEILKNDGTPYTIFTPYKRKWLEKFNPKLSATLRMPAKPNYFKVNSSFPELSEIGFQKTDIKVKDYNLEYLDQYERLRNLPAEDATSYLSPHLRFGTISIRQVIQQLQPKHEAFLSELIWREFFMQILYHFPHVVTANFNARYNGIEWHNNKQEFDLWCRGKTGYPLVDAGMRQLNETGYMHNRVRMIVAGFLCKHLLIHWSWGEDYFAEKLIDYELASNNGNWQWAAGTGCDAAPYFRVFNPFTQQKKFDKDFKYIKRWVPEYGTSEYPPPMIDHNFARKRAIETYKRSLAKAL